MKTTSRSADASNGPPGTPAPAIVRQARVLVIDDEPAITRMITRALARHLVVCVHGAEDATAALEADPSFDLVLCDVNMPGCDGLTWFREIVDRYPTIGERLVFVSGGMHDASIEAALSRLPVRRLEKPFELATIRALADACVVRG